jgi:hypothetical protein
MERTSTAVDNRGRFAGSVTGALLGRDVSYKYHQLVLLSHTISDASHAHKVDILVYLPSAWARSAVSTMHCNVMLLKQTKISVVLL